EQRLGNQWAVGHLM
nr:bombesin [Bombina bombina]prf//730327A bombesin [Bombina orientalis]